ncbi:hypothetical protein EYR36_005837 [Pleurotus pulmonarius]|nr:hypothetical protein EYR36_005830 [Pleurotus pulmonarius]KAF4574496.1 hypothetical protein EYR36_005837 [Pleurotus pulmonarius]KAF4600551.1 hypothetical protein EYR38_005183 [Pleurotus pulmonarius]KAF4600555.1 hypothetical protein EYR38_005190 [Pleurotus pulmonarius]
MPAAMRPPYGARPRHDDDNNKNQLVVVDANNENCLVVVVITVTKSFCCHDDTVSRALTACMCVYVNNEHHPAAIEPANDQQHMPALMTPMSTYIRPEPMLRLLSIMIEAVISVPTLTDLDLD